MTRDEAITITAMVANSWPDNQWNDGSIDAYARAIEPLDADTTMKALVRCVNELEHYPRIATLREYVRMEKRRTDDIHEDAVETQRMPNDVPASKLEIPQWVKGWAVSRYRYNDFRVWPQQDPHDFASNPMPKDKQGEYMVEGMKLSSEMIFRVMVGDV